MTIFRATILLAVVGVSCLSFLVFKPTLVWIICLLLLALRLFFGRCFKVSAVVVGLMMIFYGRILLFGQTIKEPLTTKAIHYLLIYPDKVKIDGASFQTEALDLQSGKKLLVTTYLHSYQEKRAFLNAQQATVWRSKGIESKFESPTNENQFDQRSHYYARKIFTRFKVTEWQKVQVSLPLKQYFLIWVHQLRQEMVLHLKTLPKPLAEYGEALFLGIHEVSFLETLDALKQTGILYLFSLSGMHVFYLITFFRVVTKRICSERSRDLMLLFCLPFYGFLGGGSFSLVRAVLMNWILILGRCVRQKV